MSFPRVVLAPAAIVAATAIGTGAAHAATCAPSSADPVDAIRQMYAGAMAGDRGERGIGGRDGARPYFSRKGVKAALAGASANAGERE